MTPQSSCSEQELITCLFTRKGLLRSGAGPIQRILLLLINRPYFDTSSSKRATSCTLSFFRSLAMGMPFLRRNPIIRLCVIWSQIQFNYSWAFLETLLNCSSYSFASPWTRTYCSNQCQGNATLHPRVVEIEGDRTHLPQPFVHTARQGRR